MWERRQTLALNVVAVLVVGCGATPSTDSIPHPPKKKEVRKPESNWSTVYAGSPVATQVSELESRLWQETVALSGIRCELDPRLSNLARRHASDVLASPDTIDTGSSDRLRFLLNKQGGTDYDMEPYISIYTSGNQSPLAQTIANRNPDWTHCGVGVHRVDSKVAAVLIGTNRKILLEPFFVSPKARREIHLKGRFRKDLRGDVQLFLGLPNRRVQKIEPVRSLFADRFEFRIPIGAPGRYELELVVDTGRGAEVAVLLPLFAEVKPDPLPSVSPDMETPPIKNAPATLLSYINTARTRAGLPPFILDPRLSNAAQAHCEDMVKHHFFGHVSPFKGALTKRLEAARLEPAESAENIAKSNSIIRIHRNLMKSPSHRINILHPDLTHVGIGIAQDDTDLVVTEIFAAW